MHVHGSPPTVADMIHTDSAPVAAPRLDRRQGLRPIISAHPLFSFWLATFALSWWAWPWFATGEVPLPVASFGPFLAALLVLGLTAGRSAIGMLLRSMVHWRVPVRWWVLMVAVPVLATAVALGLNLLLGARP